MAKSITYEFKIVDSATGTLKEVKIQAKSADEAIKKLAGEANKAAKDIAKTAQASVRSFAELTIALDGVNSAVQGLNRMVGDLTAAYQVQLQAETQLATNMRNTMGATDEQIQSIKDLCSAQQALGVIGDEVQLAGAQTLAMFASEQSTLEALIPAMNDLAAQQHGLNVTSNDTAAIAKMLGKALSGQTSVLTRYGLSFTEAQGEILKTGTEAQKAAVLAEIVSSKVGGINASLAQTDAGKMVQLNNTMGDLKEQAGAAVQSIQPFLTMGASLTTTLTGFGKLAAAFQVAYTSIVPLITSTKLWTAAQAALNVVLSANPIGIVITVLAALALGLRAAYVHSESFRNICDKVWAVLKKAAAVVVDLAKKVWEHLVKRFNQAKDALAKVWSYVKWIFGIKTEDKLPKATATATAEVERLGDAAEDTEEKIDKMLNKAAKPAHLPTDTRSAGEKRGADLSIGVWELSTLEEYDARIKALHAEQQRADARQYAELQRQVEQVEHMAEVFKRMRLPEPPKSLTEQVSAALGAKGFAVTERPKDLRPTEGVLAQQKEFNKEQEKSIDLMGEIQKGWGGMKSGVGAIESITEALEGESTLWEKITALVDGIIQLYQSFASIIEVVNTVTKAATTTKVADTAVTQTQTGANVANAASGVMAAHASIPFAGVGIAAGLIAAMVAIMASLPKFAEGGLAFGPTLGLFGEYAGAASNPEVVAPLSKLKGYIAEAVTADGAGGASEVRLRVSGRDLEAVMTKNQLFKNRAK